jgi:Dynamin family
MSDEWDVVFEMPPLGVELGQTRNRLLADIEALAALSGGTLTKRAAAIRARVRNASIRIGVIGQIKAGKSSTINALTRRAGLLPSDVNPWTSVVTRLHFGHPTGKSSGAIFRFFNDAEWDRLANRGGRLGELTEGLLEDYKREKLVEQVSAMRERAELRLGAKFAHLLGKAHRFDQVTPELLSHYVAAGDDPDARVPNASSGRFADITHSAEVFFGQAPFGFPLTLIDTPGVNDPLLIREEITQQSIENSDHFIVVLSAHQTLSKPDVRLIRLLKALNRDRFVVFVNRLDEIRNPAAELERVREKLVDTLKRELNGKEISVVLGSAAWANFALTGNEDLLDRKALSNFVAARGLAEPALRLDPTHHIADPARAEAYLASGMQELMEVISEMVLHGPAARTLEEATADLAGVASQAVERSQIRLTLMEEGTAVFRPIATADEIGRLVKDVAARTEDCRMALADCTGQMLAEATKEMAETIDRYTVRQATILQHALRQSKRGTMITCDVDPLRRELEAIFTEAFDELRVKLVRDARLFEGAVRNLMPDAIRDRVKSVRFGTTALSVLAPQMDTLYRTVSVELSLTWLGSILGSSPQKVNAALNSLRTQFRTMCAELITATRARVQEVTERVTEEFRSDMTAQMNELAGLTSAGDTYSTEEFEKRGAMREQIRADMITAQRLVETLSKAHPARSTDTEAA